MMKIGDGGLVREPLNDQMIQIGGIAPSCLGQLADAKKLLHQDKPQGKGARRASLFEPQIFKHDHVDEGGL